MYQGETGQEIVIGARLSVAWTPAQPPLWGVGEGPEAESGLQTQPRAEPNLERTTTTIGAFGSVPEAFGDFPNRQVPQCFPEAMWLALTTAREIQWREVFESSTQL